MSDNYSIAWHQYRTRHRIAVGLLVLGLPATFAIAIVFKLLSLLSEIALVGMVLLWACLFGYAAFRVVRWPCPRCGERFGGDRACANCGLGLYELP
jgi:hypothetical protein